MKFTINLLCLSLPVIFLSCQKTEYKYYKIYPELKDWFCNYHVGSYWVYQNSISGQIDTVRLISHLDTSFITIQDNINTTREECGVSCNGSPMSNSYRFSSSTSYENINNIGVVIADLIGYEIKTGLIFNGYKFSNSVDTLPLLKLDNYKVNQIVFKNILKLKGVIAYHKTDNYIGISTIYISKKVGIIQFTKLDTTFNLISYEIH